MITGGRITSVSAKRFSPEPTKGLKINISIDDIKVDGNNMTIDYTYIAKYEEAVGELIIKGELKAVEEKAEDMFKAWKNKKNLPEEFANAVLNNINYTSSVNGTFIVKPLNLFPPMLPPRFTISKKKDEKKVK